MNTEDQRRLEELYSKHKRHVESAPPACKVVLVVNKDRHGHISGEIQPPPEKVG